MLSKHLFHASNVRLCLLVAMLCGVLLTGSQTTGPVSAAELPAAVGVSVESNMMVVPKMTVNAPTDTVVVSCVVHNVGMNYIDNVVGVHSTDCTPSAGAIQYFAIVGIDTKQANQVLSVALTAIAMDKPVVLTYDPNDTNVPHPENNRKILTFGISR